MELPIVRVMPGAYSRTDCLKYIWKEIKQYVNTHWSAGNNVLINRAVGLCVDQGWTASLPLVSIIYCFLYLDMHAYFFKSWHMMYTEDVSYDMSARLSMFLHRRYHRLLLTAIRDNGRIDQCSSSLFAAVVDCNYCRFEETQTIEFEMIFLMGFTPVSLLQ